MATGNKEAKEIQEYEVNSVVIIADNPPKRFIFISDLHFDCYHQPLPIKELIQKLENKESIPEYEEDDNFIEREGFFIKFVKENFSNDILILAGDYSTDFKKTLSFVEKLESSKITSYFILGNHDFASNNKTGFNDIISLFDTTTISHEYCKFLMTGKKYYHEDVCIIGDTGWHTTSKYKIARDGSNSTDHFGKEFYEHEGKKWIKFAEDVLAHEKQVLMVTHFPQAELEGETSWINWTDTKLLLQANHCWKIFGHTHQRGLFQWYNNICSQQGYKLRKNNSDYRDYAMADFGILEKRVAKKPNESFCAVSTFNSLLPFYSTKIIQDPKKEFQAVKEVTGRGFKRTGHSDNKRAIAAMINNKSAYIECVKKNLNSIKLVEYMGYVLADVSLKVINAVNDALDILENANFSEVRSFMTAIIITGYVYNGMIRLIEYMRPVDDYDIMRWYLMFVTIQKYNFDPGEIKSVRKNEKESFYFQNVPMHLPKVNNKSLTVEEVRVLLEKTTLLPDNLLFDS